MKKLFLLSCLLLFMFSCKKDPCEDKLCLNGGTCVDGTCDCAEGYTGSDCSTQKTPTAMSINKITMTDYPLHEPGGSDWDAFSSYGDPYITISEGTSANFNGWVSPNYVDEAGGADVVLTTGLPYTLSGTLSNWTIGVWDYDNFGNSNDDYMGGVIFVPADFDSGWPDRISLSTNDFTFLIDVTWYY